MRFNISNVIPVNVLISIPLALMHALFVDACPRFHPQSFLEKEYERPRKNKTRPTPANLSTSVGAP
jgi:hypothetical protein